MGWAVDSIILGDHEILVFSYFFNIYNCCSEGDISALMYCAFCLLVCVYEKMSNKINWWMLVSAEESETENI